MFLFVTFVWLQKGTGVPFRNQRLQKGTSVPLRNLTRLQKGTSVPFSNFGGLQKGTSVPFSNFGKLQKGTSFVNSRKDCLKQICLHCITPQEYFAVIEVSFTAKFSLCIIL